MNKRDAMGFWGKGVLRRGPSKVGHTDAAVVKESGAIFASEPAERIMSEISSG